MECHECRDIPVVQNLVCVGLFIFITSFVSCGPGECLSKGVHVLSISEFSKKRNKSMGIGRPLLLKSAQHFQFLQILLQVRLGPKLVLDSYQRTCSLPFQKFV